MCSNFIRNNECQARNFPPAKTAPNLLLLVVCFKIYEDGLFDSLMYCSPLDYIEHRGSNSFALLVMMRSCWRREWFLFLLSRNLTDHGLNLLYGVSKCRLH